MHDGVDKPFTYFPSSSLGKGEIRGQETLPDGAVVFRPVQQQVGDLLGGEDAAVENDWEIGVHAVLRLNRVRLPEPSVRVHPLPPNGSGREPAGRRSDLSSGCGDARRPCEKEAACPPAT